MMAVFKDSRVKREFPEAKEDVKRHKEKVRKALKENALGLIDEEEIISSSPGKKVKIPLKSIREYQFAFSEENPQVMQAPGAEKGDRIGRPQPGAGKGDKGGQPQPGGQRVPIAPGAGDMPGEDVYDAEITIEELWELIDESLGLPRLKEKAPEKTKEEKKVRFRRTRKRPVLTQVDWAKTAEERIKRRKMDERLKKRSKKGDKK